MVDETLERMCRVLMSTNSSATTEEVGILRRERDVLRHRVLVLEAEVTARSAANQELRRRLCEEEME